MSDSKVGNTAPKQVIVVRRDLSMPQGKMSAQVAHASMAAILDLGVWDGVNNSTFTLTLDMNAPKDQAVHQWLTGSFTKIVLECYSEQQLQDLYDDAKSRLIPCAYITDSGRTFFKEPTATCIGLGPGSRDVLDVVTGHLKLYGSAILKEDGWYYGRNKLS